MFGNIIRRTIFWAPLFLYQAQVLAFGSSPDTTGTNFVPVIQEPAQTPSNPLSRSRRKVWLDENGQPVPTAVYSNVDSVPARPWAGRGATAAVVNPSAQLMNQRQAISPLDDNYRISQCKHPGHAGMDLAAPLGTPIYAVKGGVVTTAGWVRGYGWVVMIDHNDGTKSVYAHMHAGAIQAARTYVGKTVLQGSKIGEVGSTGHSTGNHLHFEYRTSDDHLLNPADEIPAIEGNASGGKVCSVRRGGQQTESPDDDDHDDDDSRGAR